MNRDNNQATPEKTSDTVSIEIGRQFHDWLSDFIAKQGDASVSERKVIEKLIHYLKSFPEKDQRDILKWLPTRPLNLPNDVMIPSGPTL